MRQGHQYLDSRPSQRPRITLRMRLPFTYHDVYTFHVALHRFLDKCAYLKTNKSTVFVTRVDSVEATATPLRATLQIVDEFFPADNTNLVIDEAHTTGLCALGGHRMGALLQLVGYVLA